MHHITLTEVVFILPVLSLYRLEVLTPNLDFLIRVSITPLKEVVFNRSLLNGLFFDRCQLDFLRGVYFLLPYLSLELNGNVRIFHYICIPNTQLAKFMTLKALFILENLVIGFVRDCVVICLD
jgi:hypothetical protein